jgi:hypothetical protein
VEAAGVVGLALPPKILNMTVPQVGHLPFIAFRPFFIVSSTALTISFLALHLTQYPSGINFFTASTLHVPSRNGRKLREKHPPTQSGKGTTTGAVPQDNKNQRSCPESTSQKSRRFSRRIVGLCTYQTELKVSADFTDWRMFLPHRRQSAESAKKVCQRHNPMELLKFVRPPFCRR